MRRDQIDVALGFLNAQNRVILQVDYQVDIQIVKEIVRSILGDPKTFTRRSYIYGNKEVRFITTSYPNTVGVKEEEMFYIERIKNNEEW